MACFIVPAAEAAAVTVAETDRKESAQRRHPGKHRTFIKSSSQADLANQPAMGRSLAAGF